MPFIGLDKSHAFLIETFRSGQCDIFETSQIALRAIRVRGYSIWRDIQWGMSKANDWGFLAHVLKFFRENDEIFMNPLAELGISPIVEFLAPK